MRGKPSRGKYQDLRNGGKLPVDRRVVELIDLFVNQSPCCGQSGRLAFGRAESSKS